MPLPILQEHSSKFNSPTTYAVTNEEPDLLRQLLGRRSFEKGAGIASGGEVLLAVLLPHCREVIAVDHSYASIANTYLKMILLETLGAKRLKELLFSADYEQIVPALRAASVSLPPELLPYVNFGNVSNGAYGYAYGSALPLTWHQDTVNLRREWHYLPTAVLERATNRLEKVTVIHGDIADVAKSGPVGLLYVSNALKHTDRNRCNPTMTGFAALVKDGGFMLLTTTASNLSGGKEWELVKCLRGIRTSWYHNLYKKKAS